MPPTPALAPFSVYALSPIEENFDAALPSFVGLGLAAHATPADLGALADRAEAGVSALQLIFDAQAAGALELPSRLADQLHQLLDRAMGRSPEAAPARPAGLALLS